MSKSFWQHTHPSACILPSQDVQGLFDLLYKNVNGFIIDEEEEKMLNTNCTVNTTYGELTINGMEALIHELNLSDQDCFYDLGAGTGKLIAHLFTRTPIGNCKGVEISHTRVEHANHAISTLKKLHPKFWYGNREISIIEKDLLEVNYDDATIIYACSTCFPKTLLEKMGPMLNQYPNIKTVISFKAIDDLKLPLCKVLHLNCTWASAVKCFIYQL